jgi:hypothetical protein
MPGVMPKTLGLNFKDKAMKILSTRGKELYSGNEATLSAAISNAIKNGISLRYADLRESDLIDASLSCANLRKSDLSGANLSRANLRGANLIGADLRNTDLRGADLRGADLCEANLIGADLSEAILSGADFRYSTGLQITGVAKSMEQDYEIVLVKDTLFIGCRHHKLHEWFAFSDETIHKMDSVSLKWWRENRDMLYAWSNAKDFGIKL